MQASLAAAMASLRNAVVVHGLDNRLLDCLFSGVLRIEVPMSRGCTALRWLQGQTGSSIAVGPACSHLAPHLYFSGRHSSAPDTSEASKAEECTCGWSAVAGMGQVWLGMGQVWGKYGARYGKILEGTVSVD